MPVVIITLLLQSAIAQDHKKGLKVAWVFPMEYSGLQNPATDPHGKAQKISSLFPAPIPW